MTKEKELNDSEEKSAWQVQAVRARNENLKWTVLWTGTFALATFGPKFLWEGNKVLTIAAIALNFGLAFGVISGFRKCLKAMDEMQQRIQLESMAWALGVGVFGGLTYSLFDITNLIASDAEIAFLVIGISFTYMAGIAIGNLRYK